MTENNNNHNLKDSDDSLAAVKTSITEMSTMIYGVMAALGVGICIWGQDNFWTLISIPSNQQDVTKLVSISILGLGVLLIGSYLFKNWFESYRTLRKSMMTFLGEVTWLQSIYLAAISSIGEEFLFRGAILPSAGIYVTSILFGLLHIGPRGNLSTWSLWAVLSGLLLGLIVQSTGSILPAIFIHFGVNAVGFLTIRKDWLKLSEVEQKKLKQQMTDLEAQES